MNECSLLEAVCCLSLPVFRQTIQVPQKKKHTGCTEEVEGMDSTSREEIKKGNQTGKDNESSGTKLPQKGVLSAPIGYLTHL